MRTPRPSATRGPSGGRRRSPRTGRAHAPTPSVRRERASGRFRRAVARLRNTGEQRLGGVPASRGLVSASHRPENLERPASAGRRRPDELQSRSPDQPRIRELDPAQNSARHPCSSPAGRSSMHAPRWIEACRARPQIGPSSRRSTPSGRWRFACSARALLTSNTITTLTTLTTMAAWTEIHRGQRVLGRGRALLLFDTTQPAPDRRATPWIH